MVTKSDQGALGALCRAGVEGRRFLVKVTARGA